MRTGFYNLVGAVLLALMFGCAPPAYAGGSDSCAYAGGSDFAATANPQAHFPQGEVIEKVTCKADPEQSYALFLPPGYTREKKWPILYAFDPGGRGAVPVKLFKDAAEKLGFIVVGSNNSKNGIDVSAVVQALSADVNERFSIDQRRVYTTGFSGGARVASAIALSSRGAVAGVIAASGGPPANFTPTPAIEFVFFTTAGTGDFNFPEMQQLKRKLDEGGVANRLVIFDGDHNWPPPEVCGEALSWMEVQAMKSGRRAKDDKVIDERLNLKSKTARAYETSQQPYEAYLEYEALVMEFRGLRDVNEFAAAAERLRNSKEVKAAIKSERAEEDSQASLSAKLESLIAQLPTAETYATAMVELRSNLSDLTKKSESSKSVAERRVAQRVLQSLMVQLYEEASALRQKKSYAAIPAKLELVVLITPKDPDVFYYLAVAYARVGNKAKATAALGRAIERGFSDLARIEQNQEFAILRDEADYKKLVAGLKKS